MAYGDYEDPNYDPFRPTSAASGPVVPPPAPIPFDRVDPTQTGPLTNPPPPAASPTPTPGPTDPWATAPADGNWETWFRTNLGRDTLSSAELVALEASLNKAGVKVLRNASGVAGKIQLPGGAIVDVIEAAGAGGNRFHWLTGGSSPSGTGAGGDAPPINPEYLAPFTQPAPSRGAPPDFGTYRPTDFHAPTGEDVTRDPSFLFRVDQGRGAVENSAAARGVLNSGGTLADILNYGQKAASQEYSNVWDRAFGVWNSDWNNALTRFRADSDSEKTAYDRAWSQYLSARDTWYANQSNPFDKIARMATIGAGAAAG